MSTEARLDRLEGALNPGEPIRIRVMYGEETDRILEVVRPGEVRTIWRREAA